MKKCLIIILLLVAIDVWGQSAWVYDRQWGGLTTYTGSGRAKFDDLADLYNNYSGGVLQRIEHLPNEQINLIKHGLRQYTVRTNDVYEVILSNNLSRRRYLALVIITAFTSGGYNFSRL